MLTITPHVRVKHFWRYMANGKQEYLRWMQTHIAHTTVLHHASMGSDFQASHNVIAKALRSTYRHMPQGKGCHQLAFAVAVLDPRAFEEFVKFCCNGDENRLTDHQIRVKVPQNGSTKFFSSLDKWPWSLQNGVSGTSPNKKRYGPVGWVCLR